MELRAAVRHIPPSSNAHAHAVFVITMERTPGLDSRITLDPVDGVFEILNPEGKLDSISPST